MQNLHQNTKKKKKKKKPKQKRLGRYATSFGSKVKVPSLAEEEISIN